MQTLNSRAFLLLAAGVLLLSPSSSNAQPLSTPSPSYAARAIPQDPEFGVSSTSVVTVSALSFQLVVGSQEGIGLDGSKYCATGGCGWLAPVNLPNGARITALELEACDGDPSFGTTFLLRAVPSPMQMPVVISPLGATSGTPECGVFPVSLDHTVDNLANSYVIELSAFASPNNIRFNAVRVRFGLQVSPAPLTATFNDVPTDHPQFQFIEALVASGITAGCGAGNYCPDAGLTRGQVAVFLAKALGLHFPN